MTTEPVSNKHLLYVFNGVKSGDRASMDELYLAMYPRLYNYAVKMVGTLDAEDILNDTMLQVWLKADAFKGDSTVSTWIFGVLHNLCLKHYRAKAAKKRQSISYIDSDDLDVLTIDQSDELNTLASLDEMEKLITELSDEHRSAILLVAEGMSYREIAEILDCPENTAKTRVFHARKLLKKALRDSHIDQHSGATS